jgi:polyisoprenoid-binding protein YceI
MFTTKIRPSVIILPFLAVWLAACAAPATPAPSNTPVPPTAVLVAATAAVPAATVGPAATTGAPAATATTGASDPAPTAAGASGGSMTYELVPANSEASYALREQLARQSLPNDAIGKTQAVAGSITVNPDGTIDATKSKFTVEAGTLKSDQGMRDGYVSGRILQTSQYPQVVFVPKTVSGLPASLPTSGDVTFQVTGDLTIRDVTKPITWDVTGSVANGEATGTATTSFTFEDFNLPQPQVPVVLSVVDKITLNVKLDLKQTAP